MPRILLPALLLCCLQSASAQFKIGLHDNMLIGQTPLSLSLTTVPLGSTLTQADSMDFDQDGVYDLRFVVHVQNEATLKAAWTEVEPLTATEIVLLNPGEAKRFDPGTVLVPNQHDWGVGASLTFRKEKANGGMTLRSGDWQYNSAGYVAFRKLINGDTLYGWVRLQHSLSEILPAAQLNIPQNWGFQSKAPIPFNNFVVAGKYDGLIPQNDVINLHQAQGSFGSFGNKIDSLDLNSDGIFDVACIAAACNSFDCVMGSTTIANMHPGFNFINGPESVRRFLLNDTIKDYANWDLNSNRYGTLLSSGSGLFGTQNLGEWINQYYGYVGFQLITPQNDTLLGWMHVFTYGSETQGAHLEIKEWAIQPTPMPAAPEAEIEAINAKPVFCAGDLLQLQAQTQHADYVVWDLWDGSRDSSALLTRVLPANAGNVTLRAGNEQGETSVLFPINVSQIAVTAEDLLVTCYHPVDTLAATTNAPATLWWIINLDTIPAAAAPLIATTANIVALAQDQHGCYATDTVYTFQDTNVPTVSIAFDSLGLSLTAFASDPQAVFVWNTFPEPHSGSSINIAQSGIYTVVATTPNGCTASATIEIILSGLDNPDLEQMIGISPNPAHDFLQIENKTPEILRCWINDLAGKQVLDVVEIGANSTMQQPLSLPKGMYLLNWQTPKGRVSSRKILVH